MIAIVWFAVCSTLAILGLVWIALVVGETLAIAVAGGVILAVALFIIIGSYRDRS